MIVGNGMMAIQFASYKDNSDVIICASGLSNSKETRYTEFEREYKLIEKLGITNKDKLFVYFSTSGMYDTLEKSSLYVKHKLNLENYIQSNFKQYYIFRVSQIIGRANNTTLINYLINNILLDKEFEVWGRTTRNLIALNDVFKIIDYIIKNQILKNKIINIANPNNISVIEVVGFVEKVLRKKANYKVVNYGFPFEKVNISDIDEIINKLNIEFNKDNYYLNAINTIICKS